MTRRQVLANELLPLVAAHWTSIRKACARSLKKKATGFLPDEPTQKLALGCGFWGCVWQAADKRFVVKASLDATEGPHVALAMKLFQKHPGLAYYHRLWRLPERVWTDEFGYTYVWIMLREEVDFQKQYSRTKRNKPARGYQRVYNVLEEIPDCCSCLVFARVDAERGCDPETYQESQHELLELTASLKSTPGVYVGKLIADAWRKHGVLLGDVHYDNVGTRIHNLSAFGVKNHRKLVVTDLGDWGQSPITTDRFPSVKVLPNPVGWYGQVAERIPVLPESRA